MSNAAASQKRGIYIEAKPVPGFSRQGYYHAYLVYRDGKGNERVIRGGPEGDSIIGKATLALGGDIQTEIGVPLNQSTDAYGPGETPSSRFSQKLPFPDDQLDRTWEIMERSARKIDPAEVDYDVRNPWLHSGTLGEWGVDGFKPHKNSNSVVARVLKDAGVPITQNTLPKGLAKDDLPGIDNTLDDDLRRAYDYDPDVEFDYSGAQNVRRNPDEARRNRYRTQDDLAPNPDVDFEGRADPRTPESRRLRDQRKQDRMDTYLDRSAEAPQTSADGAADSKPPTTDPFALVKELEMDFEAAAGELLDNHDVTEWADVDGDIVGLSDRKRNGNHPGARRARDTYVDYVGVNYGTGKVSPDATGRLPQPKRVRAAPAESALVRDRRDRENRVSRLIAERKPVPENLFRRHDPTPDPLDRPFGSGLPGAVPKAAPPPSGTRGHAPESLFRATYLNSRPKTAPVPGRTAPDPLDSSLAPPSPARPVVAEPAAAAPKIAPPKIATAPRPPARPIARVPPLPATPDPTEPASVPVTPIIPDTAPLPGAAASRVICTELFRQGLMDRELYVMDLRFTENFLTPTHVRGYHLWAVPLALRMRFSPKLTRRVEPIARHRALEIAHQLDPDRFPPDWRGKLVRWIAEPICYLLGLAVPDKPVGQVWETV